MNDPLLIQTLLRKQSKKVPAWFMRQAGRYLPEYLEIRSKLKTIQMFKDPEIASKITLQPLKRFNLDAAIIYADILLIPDAMGYGLEFFENIGPVFKEKVDSKICLEALVNKVDDNKDLFLDNLNYVFRTVSNTKAKLEKGKALLGFAGSPFTVLTYMIEGKSPQKNYIKTKKLIFSYPKEFHKAMQALSELTTKYLILQIQHGVDAVQIFESFSSVLGYDDYEEFVLPYLSQIIDNVSSYAPSICFFENTSHLKNHLHKINTQGISLDWRTCLKEFSNEFSNKFCLQGNLDPLYLFSSKKFLEKKVRQILDLQKEKEFSFIFNLGHGILPKTPIENIEFCLELLSKYND